MDNPLVQVDPGLFIWTIVTFLVLLTLLAKFAWTPLLQALESRQALIRKSLDDAQQATKDLERLSLESAQIISRARAEAEAIVSQSRSDGDRLREEIKQKARAEADHIVKNAERQIQLETSRALEQIRREAVDLSVMIASKIIQRNLSKEDNERLIDEALRQVQNRSPGGRPAAFVAPKRGCRAGERVRPAIHHGLSRARSTTGSTPTRLPRWGGAGHGTTKILNFCLIVPSPSSLSRV